MSLGTQEITKPNGLIVQWLWIATGGNANTFKLPILFTSRESYVFVVNRDGYNNTVRTDFVSSRQDAQNVKVWGLDPSAYINIIAIGY